MNLIKILPLNRTKLRVLLEVYAEGEDYLRNIEKKTKINPSLLFRILKNFHAAGLLMKKSKGKENYYSLVDDGLMVEILEKFHLDQVLESSKELKTLFKLISNNKNMPASEIYLFGSFVQGNHTKKSDFDILFIGKDRKNIIKWCRETSIVLGREINPLIYTPDKFKLELKRKEPMLNSVLKIKNRVIIKRKSY